MYNLTFLDNATSLPGIIGGVNDNSGGVLATAILLFLWVIIFISAKSDDKKAVMLAASFITSIIAGFLFGLGWISPWVLGIPLIMLLITLIIKIWGDG